MTYDSYVIHSFTVLTILSAIFIQGCVTDISTPLTNISLEEHKTDYCSEAVELISSENYDEALLKLNKAIKADSSNVTPFVLKSRIYLKTEKYNESIESAKAAINIDPRISESFLNTEISLLRLGLKNHGISYLGNITGDYEINRSVKTANTKITINMCNTDSENSEFWRRWNRINLWEFPGGGRYMGTTNACDNVEIYVLDTEISGNQIYYKIKEVNRNLEGWI